MAQPFQQSSIVIPVHPRECGQFHFCTVFPALTVYYLRFVKTIDALRHRVVSKRKLTAVCSHQTKIGNLDAHLI
uniref:Uncharacterized protein n=1 Tax=Escherichia coli TaxID=562 RepID=A1YN27_ECOLX|nr:hypothetical protein ECf0011 [Escherichia coli]WEG97218.1 hypothetical protein DMLCCNKA_00221 [Escherichia coli]